MLEECRVSHRFINIEHFLFGLSLSRVGETVQRILDDRGLKCYYLGKHPEVQVPLYKIYNSSAKAARENGEEVVRLEHFALVVIAWKLQKDPPSKMAMDAKTCPANVGIIEDAELLEALEGAIAEPRGKSWRSEASSVYQKML